MDQQAEKNPIERVTGQDRRTREELAKWDKITALRFQKKGETSNIPGLPWRGGRGREETSDDDLCQD